MANSVIKHIQVGPSGTAYDIVNQKVKVGTTTFDDNAVVSITGSNGVSVVGATGANPTITVKGPSNYVIGGSQTTTSSDDGGSNVFTFNKSDGTSATFTVKNGSKGSTGTVGPTGPTGPAPDLTKYPTLAGSNTFTGTNTFNKHVSLKYGPEGYIDLGNNWKLFGSYLINGTSTSLSFPSNKNGTIALTDDCITIIERTGITPPTKTAHTTIELTDEEKSLIVKDPSKVMFKINSSNVFYYSGAWGPTYRYDPVYPRSGYSYYIEVDQRTGSPCTMYMTLQGVVTSNPALSGSETALTSISIDGTPYKIGAGGDVTAAGNNTFTGNNTFQKSQSDIVSKINVDPGPVSPLISIEKKDQTSGIAITSKIEIDPENIKMTDNGVGYAISMTHDGFKASASGFYTSYGFGTITHNTGSSGKQTLSLPDKSGTFALTDDVTKVIELSLSSFGELENPTSSTSIIVADTADINAIKDSYNKTLIKVYYKSGDVTSSILLFPQSDIHSSATDTTPKPKYASVPGADGSYWYIELTYYTAPTTYFSGTLKKGSAGGDVTAAGNNLFTGTNTFKTETSDNLYRTLINLDGVSVGTGPRSSIAADTTYGYNDIKRLNTSNLYTYTFPSKSGVFALTRDIPIKTATLSGTTLRITLS